MRARVLTGWAIVLVLSGGLAPALAQSASEPSLVLRPKDAVGPPAENLLRSASGERIAMRAQPRDPDVDGVLLGTAIGAVGGFIVAPYLFCGHGFDDTECTTIVRLAIGVPVAIGGAVTGGLIDHFHNEGVVVWRHDASGHDVRVAVVPGPRPRANLVVGFR
jgi:hypothetical protein